MSIGGLWTDCLRKYANEISAITTEGAQATFFYRLALQNIMNDPETFIRSMWMATSRFLSDLPTLPVTWYHWPEQTYLSILAMLGLYASATAGWIYIIRHRIKTYQIAFCMFFALGVLVSVPLIYFEDARRVLVPVYPIWAMAIAGGVVAPATLRIHGGHSIRLSRCGLIAGASITLVVFVWAGLRWLHPDYQAWGHAETALAPGERIIAGRELLSGIVVLPDSAGSLDDTPSMSITEFRSFLRAANIDSSASLLPLPPVPFAFFNTHVWNTGADSTYAGAYSTYFVPPDVMRDKSVRRWKVKARMVNQVENWLNVESAVPLP
jgi:hypothetical protein